MKHIELNLPLLLPDTPDARDACVSRLQALLAETKGIIRTHLVEPTSDEGTALCVDYDPDQISLAEVERRAAAAGAEITTRFGHLLIPIRLIGSEDAPLRIESRLRGLPGVLSASVSLPAQQARIEFDLRTVSADQIRSQVHEFGYGAAEPGDVPLPSSEVSPKPSSWYWRNRELAWSLIAGGLLIVAWAGGRWFEVTTTVAIVLYVISYAFGGFDLVRHWVKDARQGKLAFDIDLLMLLAALGAAVLGEWAEGAFLLFLFSLAHALEHYALGRARNAIRALADLAPPIARVQRNAREFEVPIESVLAGDLVIVRPAERIPVDGVIARGKSAVNQAPITGESVPVDKAEGDEVFAGTVNGEGALEISTTRAVGDRTLDRVVRLVEEAQTQKAPTQRFTERFERIFVPVVLIADILLIVLPPLLGLWDWSTSFYRGMALLVAASPCALALGTPATVLAGIAQAARKGVLIKGGAHLEHLGTLRAMALDKTGTLTRGEPEVTDLRPVAGVDLQELLTVSAAVEQRSQHPLAQAVVRRAAADGLALPTAGALESVTARGVRSELNGQVVEIGSLRMWEEAGITVPAEVRDAVEALRSTGQSTMSVRYGDRWLGTIGLADQPREGVRTILDRLRGLGVSPLVMLTGDNAGVGAAIGRDVGIDEVKADLLPEDKVDAVQELIAIHGQVAMVGDGVNDAPALANATVGIAMGGAGTAVALETADIALMADDLGKLPFAVGLSRQARGIIRQNLFVSLTVIGLLILATISGVFGIGIAVAVHEGSTLIVVGNALRLLRYDPE